MKLGSRSGLVFSALLLLSHVAQASSSDSLFEFELSCDDLHRGEYITDETGTYPVYEMEDGYSGKVEIIVSGEDVSIYRNDLLAVEKKVTSESVTMDPLGFLKIATAEYNYYTFSFIDDEALLVNHVFTEGDTVKDAFLECEYVPDTKRVTALYQHIQSLKVNES
ncbi:hypothetical protein P0Y67_14170 [Photobacterium sp. SP02]|uniref:hypothetical protein n=1 Tax=Photobacterium sp. SP02 TaxID=3032280 RepID=UPI0031452D64